MWSLGDFVLLLMLLLLLILQLLRLLGLPFVLLLAAFCIIGCASGEDALCDDARASSCAAACASACFTS